MDGVGKFYELFFAYPEIFAVDAIFIAIVHFFLLRKYVYSFFDPFFLTAIVFSFYSIDMLFMYQLNAVSDYYFYHFFITQVLFFIGFIFYKPINIERNRLLKIKFKRQHEIEFQILFYLISFIFIVAQIISYLQVGIPILMEARLSAYQGGGGAGVLGRVIPVTLMISMFMLIDRFFGTNSKSRISKLYDWFLLFFGVVAFFSTGSKASILVLVQLLFLFGFYYVRFEGYQDFFSRVYKLQKVIFIVAVLGAVSVIVIESRIFELNCKST